MKGKIPNQFSGMKKAKFQKYVVKTDNLAMLLSILKGYSIWINMNYFSPLNLFPTEEMQDSHCSIVISVACVLTSYIPQYHSLQVGLSMWMNRLRSLHLSIVGSKFHSDSFVMVSSVSQYYERDLRAVPKQVSLKSQYKSCWIYFSFQLYIQLSCGKGPSVGDNLQFIFRFCRQWLRL